MKHTWTQQQAIELCVAIEQYAPSRGAHVGLTGGCLYKTGPRRDCDILLYRHDKNVPVDFDGLMKDLKAIGIEPDKDEPGYGYYHRAWQGGRRIDFLCKEEDGEYLVDDPADKLTTDDLLP